MSKVIGHANLEMTMIYAHLLTEHRQRVMNMLVFGPHVIGGRDYGKIWSKRQNEGALAAQKSRDIKGLANTGASR